ncbi:ORF58 [Spodoptera eridania nucleopolyhedrovirus]|uniref:ORF58 n=1 Tax=Spodoptera eridania nucleopolyhedrovirus TaxID=2315721 RepID=A0A346TPZ6_9ABAC|nr:ORF58 [Spodoptera eridania nucleopolyhedrovirus]AXU41656.1 ORF58 [Spodoptera eridania nucleopolyhedrovirus]
MSFQPRCLKSLAFTTAINDAKTNRIVNEAIPNFIVDDLWRDYLNSHRLSCDAIMEYVYRTNDFSGALKCVLKHNTYCEETLRFEWNLKRDIDWCADDSTTLHDALYTYFLRNLTKLSKEEGIEFVLMYMYALSEWPQFMPRQLTVTIKGFNSGGKCHDCDEEGANEYDHVFFEILSYKMYAFNQTNSIKLMNRLLLRDERFRCEECGALLISYIDPIY